MVFFNSLFVSRGVISEKRLNTRQFTNRNIFLNNIYCKCKDSMTKSMMIAKLNLGLL